MESKVSKDEVMNGSGDQETTSAGSSDIVYNEDDIRRAEEFKEKGNKFFA
jgi:hypothetical protein